MNIDGFEGRSVRKGTAQLLDIAALEADLRKVDNDVAYWKRLLEEKDRRITHLEGALRELLEVEQMAKEAAQMPSPKDSLRTVFMELQRVTNVARAALRPSEGGEDA